MRVGVGLERSKPMPSPTATFEEQLGERRVNRGMPMCTSCWVQCTPSATQQPEVSVACPRAGGWGGWWIALHD
jgi:hypothetical protein